MYGYLNKMIKKKNIQTTNREIYEKFNLLHFSPEILLSNVKEKQLTRVLNRINKDNNMLGMEKVDKYIIVKKIRPFSKLNYNMYLK